MYVMHFLPFYTIKTLTLRMDHAKLLDVLTSLPVSRSILPRAVYFATSHPANHAICSFIDSGGYASGPIRRCLFIDYIIICLILCLTAQECLPVDSCTPYIKIFSFSKPAFNDSLDFYKHCNFIPA